MTWTPPDSDENGRAFDIDLDRVIYDPEYRNEVKSALASSTASSVSNTVAERD